MLAIHLNAPKLEFRHLQSFHHINTKFLIIVLIKKIILLIVLLTRVYSHLGHTKKLRVFKTTIILKFD
jgi:hypothetical protein